MNSGQPPESPLEKFKHFVSEILTVTKEDVQKREAERKAVFPPKPPANDDEGKAAE